MKLKRIYTKLLLSFFGVLIITLVLIFAMFVVTAGRAFREEVNRQAFGKLSVFKTVVTDKLQEHPFIPVQENPDLMEMFQTFSQLFDVKIWITDPKGRVPVRTFSGPAVPPPAPRFKYRVREWDGIRLTHLSRRRISYYAVIPMQHMGDALTLHLHFDARKFHHPEGPFFMGILLIGGIIALLLIPLARIITRRINALNRTALAFADGDLARRATVVGRDEIAALSESFNFMADKLEKLIQGSKDLTANVSHELRSPLARIRMSRELILSKMGKPGKEADIQRLFLNMETDILALDSLIDQMLKLSKLDFQAWEPSPDSLDLADFLSFELEKYAPLFKEKQIRMDQDLPPALPVFQDKTVLITLFSNLLDNAVKYTPDNGTVRIHARNRDNGLHMQVSNTCPPLAPDDLSKIFDPFYRVRGSNAQGHGLGLAITQKQVERCKGRISACNSRRGLMFEIFLPSNNTKFDLS